MLDRLNQLSISAYLNAARFIHELKEDERGLSGIVVAVLLILVAVLAVTMIWGLLSGWLQDLWDNITSNASNIQ